MRQNASLAHTFLPCLRDFNAVLLIRDCAQMARNMEMTVAEWGERLVGREVSDVRTRDNSPGSLSK